MSCSQKKQREWFEILKKIEINKDTKGKTLFTHWKNIVKMSILPKASYILTATPIRFVMTCFYGNRKKILKILQKHKTLNSHRNLEKEEER